MQRRSARNRSRTGLALLCPSKVEAQAQPEACLTEVACSTVRTVGYCSGSSMKMATWALL